MGEQWKPSALRAADGIEFGVTISTRDGRQLVHEWHAALARAERAEAVVSAIPWQTLLNISHALEASDAAHDCDEAALLTFLNRYAPWVPSSESERG